MMEKLAPVGRLVVLVVAADAAAMEIAQLAGIADGLEDRAAVSPATDRCADVAPERANAHDQREDRIEKGGAEQSGHRIMRHQLVEGAGTGVHAKQYAAVVESRKAEDEGGHAERGNDADDEAVACEGAGQRLRPGIGGIRFGARHRQRLGNVDVELVRRRELAVDIAGAAGMAEVGEIVEIAVGEGAAHLHRGKHRAKTLAIAAGIADRHQTVGFVQNSSSVHVSPLPVLRSARTRCRWSCPCRRHNPCRARCRP